MNSICTIDKAIFCLKLKDSKIDLLKNLHFKYYNQSEGKFIMGNLITLTFNNSKNENDIEANTKLDLNFNKDKVGILFIGTKSKGCFYFKIFNEINYSKKYSISAILNELLVLFDLDYSINNITKLDIACDTINNTVGQDIVVYEDLCLNNHYFSNLKKRKDKYDNSIKELNGRSLEQVQYQISVPRLTTQQSNGIVHIGRPKNKKSISIYNKSEFLADHHISYFNQHFGIAHPTVIRIELRLRSEFFTNNSIDINKLDDHYYITEYFKSHAKDYLTFDKIQEKPYYDSNNNKKYPKICFLDSLDFIILKNNFIENPDSITLNNSKIQNTVAKNRATLTNLFNKYSTQENDESLTKIIDHVKNEKLDYLSNTFGKNDSKSIYNYIVDRFTIYTQNKGIENSFIDVFKDTLKEKMFGVKLKFNPINKHGKLEKKAVYNIERSGKKFGIEVVKHKQ